jgi:ankyrin repeat protein
LFDISIGSIVSYFHCVFRHWAAIGNAVEVADLLGNVDVSAPTKSGSTPLHLAADAGKTEFVNWCIAKGADVKAVEPSSGKTPFQLAKASNHAAIMAAISKAGGGEPGCCVIS